MKILISLSKEYKDRPFTGKGGLYAAVEPIPESKKAIQKMCGRCFNAWYERVYDQDLEIESDLHCTIMYSPKKVPNNLEDASWFLPTDTHEATASKFRWWEGHDKKGYLVLELESEGLVAEHNRLQDSGCEPTFEEYIPHITIKKGLSFKDDAEEKGVLRYANLILRRNPLEITLTNQQVQDIVWVLKP